MGSVHAAPSIACRVVVSIKPLEGVPPPATRGERAGNAAGREGAAKASRGQRPAQTARCERSTQEATPWCPGNVKERI